MDSNAQQEQVDVAMIAWTKTVLGEDSAVADELHAIGLDAQSISQLDSITLVEILRETGLPAATRTKLIVNKGSVVNHLTMDASLLKGGVPPGPSPHLGLTVFHQPRWYELLLPGLTFDWAKIYKDPLLDQLWSNAADAPKAKAIVEGQNARVAVVATLFFAQLVSLLKAMSPKVHTCICFKFLSAVND